MDSSFSTNYSITKMSATEYQECLSYMTQVINQSYERFKDVLSEGEFRIIVFKSFAKFYQSKMQSKMREQFFKANEDWYNEGQRASEPPQVPRQEEMGIQSHLQENFIYAPRFSQPKYRVQELQFNVNSSEQLNLATYPIQAEEMLIVEPSQPVSITLADVQQYTKATEALSSQIQIISQKAKLFSEHAAKCCKLAAQLAIKNHQNSNISLSDAQENANKAIRAYKEVQKTKQIIADSIKTFKHNFDSLVESSDHFFEANRQNEPEMDSLLRRTNNALSEGNNASMRAIQEWERVIALAQQSKRFADRAVTMFKYAYYQEQRQFHEIRDRQGKLLTFKKKSRSRNEQRRQSQ